MKSTRSIAIFDIAKIARRRQRLSIDYHLRTRAMLEAHFARGRGTRITASQWFASLRRQFLPHYFHSPPRWRIFIRAFRKDRALPDFCIIGPLKSGTSDLAVTIMAHPNILPPLVKEFSSTDPLAWKPFYPTLKAVQRHTQRHGAALCPFVAPCLHCLDIPIALSTIRPDTKIIINLRNPVDLVFSEWKWYVLNKDKHLVDKIPFLASFAAYIDNAIELFPDVTAPFGPTLHYGIYAKSVSNWIQCFGNKNVRVFNVDDYFNDRNRYLERLELFLGLPHALLPHRLPITNHNPLNDFKATQETRLKLRNFFAPYNRRLWEIIGTTFPW